LLQPNVTALAERSGKPEDYLGRLDKSIQSRHDRLQRLMIAAGEQGTAAGESGLCQNGLHNS